MSWTDQKPHIATAEEVSVFKRVKKPWRCGFCGRPITEGTSYRWVYTNDIKGAGGNPFVCEVCDDGATRQDLASRYKQLRAEFHSPKFASFRHRGE